jgi:hypothetical protein
MTRDHRVRRLLARVCSAETMVRVVDPTLADMRVEHDRPRWRGYVSLARALLVHAVLSLPDAVAGMWRDDDHAVPRLALLSCATAIAAAWPFVFVPFLGPLRNVFVDAHGVIPRTAHTLAMLGLLMPQALVITVPPAVLLAWPLAARRSPITRRTARRAIAVAGGACVVMAALLDRGAPEANQRFRVIVSGNPQVERGEAEYGFRALRAQMERLRTSPYVDDATRARVLPWWQYRYHLRIALIVAPIPILVLAAGLGSTPLARRRPWMLGIGSMTAYLVSVFALDTFCGAIAAATAVPPVVFAWLPTAALLVGAAAISRGASPADPRCA